MKDTILYGDCRNTLKTITEKVSVCYIPTLLWFKELGNEDDQIGMEQTPEEYIQQLVEVFRSVRDYLSDDGT